PSFPAGLPLLALDRIIANRKGIISEVEAHDTPLARIASDHLPIKALVDLGPVAA
ncbi:EEP domain-containing protein, partial [Rhizobium leguminosarum bv. viciae]